MALFKGSLLHGVFGKCNVATFFGCRWNGDEDAVPASMMMKTLMGIAAKNLTASDEESLMPRPVNAWTPPISEIRAKNSDRYSSRSSVRFTGEARSGSSDANGC